MILYTYIFARIAPKQRESRAILAMIICTNYIWYRNSRQEEKRKKKKIWKHTSTTIHLFIFHHHCVVVCIFLFILCFSFLFYSVLPCIVFFSICIVYCIEQKEKKKWNRIAFGWFGFGFQPILLYQNRRQNGKFVVAANAFVITITKRT